MSACVCSISRPYVSCPAAAARSREMIISNLCERLHRPLFTDAVYRLFTIMRRHCWHYRRTFQVYSIPQNKRYCRRIFVTVTRATKSKEFSRIFHDSQRKDSCEIERICENQRKKKWLLGVSLCKPLPLKNSQPFIWSVPGSWSYIGTREFYLSVLLKSTRKSEDIFVFPFALLQY